MLWLWSYVDPWIWVSFILSFILIREVFESFYYLGFLCFGMNIIELLLFLSVDLNHGFGFIFCLSFFFFARDCIVKIKHKIISRVLWLCFNIFFYGYQRLNLVIKFFHGVSFRTSFSQLPLLCKGLFIWSRFYHRDYRTSCLCFISLFYILSFGYQKIIILSLNS